MFHRAQPLASGGTAGLVLGQLVASGKGAMRATKQLKGEQGKLRWGAAQDQSLVPNKSTQGFPSAAGQSRVYHSFKNVHTF